MPKYWTEPLDPSKHVDFMRGYQAPGGVLIDEPAGSRLVYFVRVCGFTFQFQSIDQVDEALRRFERQTQPSSRAPNDGLEHYWHSWFDRLPSGLAAGSKRVRVISALKQARKSFSS